MPVGNGLKTWNVKEVCFEAIPVKNMGLFCFGKVSFSLVPFRELRLKSLNEGECGDQWVKVSMRCSWRYLKEYCDKAGK